MASIDSRLAKLERADPPAVVRPQGEPIEEFIARMDVALRGIIHADPFDEEEHSRAMDPWLAAVTHAELRGMLDAIESVQAARVEGRSRRATGNHAVSSS